MSYYYVRSASRIWHKVPASAVTGRYTKELALQAHGPAVCGRKPTQSSIGDWHFVAGSVLGERVCKNCEALA